jgi:hypothetical protein
LLSSAGAPVIQNIVLPIAEIETKIPLDRGCKKLLLQVREGGDLKIAFKEGESATNYFTLRGFNTYYEDLIVGPFSLYIQSETDNTIVEIVTWYHYD